MRRFVRSEAPMAPTPSSISAQVPGSGTPEEMPVPTVNCAMKSTVQFPHCPVAPPEDASLGHIQFAVPTIFPQEKLVA